MAITIDTIHRYRFTYNESIVDRSQTFSIQIKYSSRDEYDDDGDIVYRIKEIGVDSSGFYYIQEYYYWDYNTGGIWTRYTKYTDTIRINSLSGTFIIDFVCPFGSSASVPNIYEPSIAELPVPEIVNTARHTNASLTYTTDEFGNTVLRLTVNFTAGYKYNSNNFVASFDYIGYPDNESLSGSYVNVKSHTTTQIVIDINLYVPSVETYNTCAMTTLYLQNFDIVKTPLSITNTFVGVTGNNGASYISYGSTYTNTLSVLSTYTFDGLDIHVFMDEEELDINTVYDALNHVITIASVKGDIQIYATAKRYHTFRFYTYDGTTLIRTISNLTEITKLRIHLGTGSTRMVYINGVFSFSYGTAIPTGYALGGLGVGASNHIEIPLEIEVNTSYTIATNFHEVMVPVVQVPSTFTLSLYNSKAEKNKVDKTNDLDLFETLQGTLRDGVDILKPVVRFEYSGFIDSNYAFIPQFNRYYFIEDIVSVSKDIWDVHLKVDVLMTYKEKIASQYALVDRNQYEFDVNIEDNQRSYTKEPEIEYIEIPNSVFDVSTSGTTIFGTQVDRDLRFVLTVVGKE